MYNLVIVVVLVMLLFFLSHDKKFGKLFNKNTSLQITCAIVVAYFSLNNISFGILMVVTILMILRYSHINNNLVAPLKDKYKTPLIKDIHRLIDKFRDSDDDDNETVDNETVDNNLDINTDELKNVFADLDRKMNSMINK